MWVNISQAAKLTGYKYGEIRRLIAKGAFPFYHNGKKAFKFELEDLKTAMKAEMEATQAAAKKKWEEQQLGARPFDFSGRSQKKRGIPAASSKAVTAGMSSTSAASSNDCKRKLQERMRLPEASMEDDAMRVHTQKGMKDNYMIFAMRAADEQRAAVKANTHRGNAERRDFLTEIVKDVAATAGVAIGWAFIAAGCAVIQ